MSTRHFEDKSVPEHLKAARIKGALASSEHHGRELSGAFSASIDSVKETALLLCVLSLLMSHAWLLWIALLLGWLVGKVGRSSKLGWARLERFQRLIEEERYEIEHHRDSEREELKEIYEAKGFQGELLDEVLDVLMADDNRLLMVMLEEELGLPLESYEHPLRQACGAGLGVVVATAMAWIGSLCPPFGISIATGLVFCVASVWAARREKNDRTKALIWNLAVGALAVATTFFVHELFI